MPTFIYKGKTRAGKAVSGEMEAESREEIFRNLRKSSVIVTTVKKKPKELSLSFGTGVKPEDITNFARQFSAMISAGLPLMQCLSILMEQCENPKFKKVLVAIYQNVEQGNSLADSMRKHPKVFPDLFVNMIAAGELGGILDTIFLRLATFMEKADALKRKIKGAMMYPLVVSTVLVGAVVGLLTFVVPIFAKMFSDFGGVLPAPTRIVVALSDIVASKWGFVILGTAIFLGIMYKKFTNTPQGRLIKDKLVLKAPVFGDLARKSSIAAFARTLGTLLSSGVSILEALDITAKTASNRVVHDALKDMIGAISEGKTITDPMKETGVFPPMVIQMVAVGEQSGGLDNMLTKLADFYDEEVNASVETLTSVMEPIIIVILAVVMGGVLIAMYLPMFSLVETVGG